MSETTYSVQLAKSGRAKCKTCKEPIAKGELKIFVEAPLKEGADFAMSSSHKVSCFKIPRKLKSKGVDVEEFFNDYLQDDGTLKEDRRDEILRMLEEAQAKTKTKKAKTGGSGAYTLMDRLKKAAEDGGDDDEPAKKKAKGDAKDEDFRSMLRAYKQYHKGFKAPELKDILRWNIQIMTGNKDFLTFKVIDGVTNGRLMLCPLCGGPLKYLEGDYDTIHCGGRYDEDLGQRIPCMYTTPRIGCPESVRAHPFYTEEPTEEEKEALSKMREDIREGSSGNSSDSPVAQELLKAAKALDGKLDFGSNAGKKQAVGEFVALVDGKVDLPQNRNVNMEIGKLAVANSQKSPEEIMQLIIDKYGFVEAKEEKAAAKEAAAETACANPKNAALVLAFAECAKYYFAEKNTNAALSYKKANKALMELEEEVTEENALSFSKGKTKLPGIGASTGKKMLEFCQTGTFAKLEEKRQAHA